MKKAAVAGALALAALFSAPGERPGERRQPAADHLGARRPRPSTAAVALAERLLDAAAGAGAQDAASDTARHVKQRMDVYWRANDPLIRPVVFMIHGGWWSGGDKAYMKAVTRSYFDLGYVVVNINYRLSGDAKWPAQRDDALDAIATARLMAGQFGLDPDRYAIIGFSAGGHIAASVGHLRRRPARVTRGRRRLAGDLPAERLRRRRRPGHPRAAQAAPGGRRPGRRLPPAASAPASGRAWRCRSTPPRVTRRCSASTPTREFVPPYQSELLRESLGALRGEHVGPEVPWPLPQLAALPGARCGRDHPVVGHRTSGVLVGR